MGVCAMENEVDVIRWHILNHAIARKGYTPESKWGKNRFAVEPTLESFRPVAEAMGIGPGTKVIHTHTTSGHYRKLLEALGARVDAVDISLDSALRSGAAVEDAMRLVNNRRLRGKYDVAFAFEPTHLFHLSGSIVSSAAYLASLMHALKENGKIYLLARAYVTGGAPADSFEAVLETLAKNFGLKYRTVENRDGKDWWERHTFTVRSQKGDGNEEVHKIQVFQIDRDERARKMLLKFAQQADRAIMEAFRGRTQIGHSLKEHEREIDTAIERLRQRKIETADGQKSTYDVLMEYAKRGEAYIKTF